MNKTEKRILLGVAFILVALFSAAIGSSVTNSEASELDLYCKAQDIDLEYNNSIKATESGLVVQCVDDGEAWSFLLTRGSDAKIDTTEEGE
ncbi:hypothetical protein [Haloplanus natans]|uniref:hypothetical protein n=1 Tax=Haloplanus natans TaxID=376171 RepID=UPI0012FB2C48|nr:hypothetical protein [Haloplanus natans]